MPIYVNFSAIGGNVLNVRKGQVYGMTQGLKTITPSNLSRMGWVAAGESHGLNHTPVDPATGQPSGKRQHEPITIRKEVDSASPLYLTALANNKVFPKLDLNFLKTNAQGKTEPYFTITLTNAALVSIGRKPAPRPPSGRQQYVTNELEEIKITFQKIVYTWIKGGISSSDDWDAPV